MASPTLLVSPAGGGSITITKVVDGDTTYYLPTATENRGYHFSHFTVEYGGNYVPPSATWWPQWPPNMTYGSSPVSENPVPPTSEVKDYFAEFTRPTVHPYLGYYDWMSRCYSIKAVFVPVTNLILRDKSSGIILRDAASGEILRDG